MTATNFSRKIIPAAILVLGFLLLVRLGFAQQPAVSDMLQNFGSSSLLGTYEGSLYCIRCNVSPSPENRALCDKEGHEHFLLMTDGHVHPLYGITREIAAKINSKELHEKTVRIRGRYFPVSNAILVNDITPTKP